MGSDPMMKQPHQPKPRRTAGSTGSSRDAALRAATRDTRSLLAAPADTTRSAQPPASSEPPKASASPEPSKLTTSPTSPELSKPSPSPESSKSHKSAGRKIFCTLCVLLGLILLGLGGLAIWYFGFHHQPETAFFDALAQLADADSVTLQGGASITSHSDGDTNAAVTLDFVATPETPGMFSGTLALMSPVSSGAFTTGSSSPKFQINSVTDDDGITYLQLSGLADWLANLPTAELTPEQLSLIDSYRATLETIDNEWWQISVTDFIDSLELDPYVSGVYHDFYGCLWDLSQTNYRALFAALYRQHPFLQLTESEAASGAYDTYYIADAGSTAYTATINFEELAAFLNQIPTTDAAESYFACFNNIEGIEETLDATDLNEITAAELQEALPGELKVEFIISNWDHQLQAFAIDYRPSDELTLSVSAKLAYQSAIITIPESYRPTTDLVDELTEFTFATIMLNSVISSDPTLDQSEIIINEEIYEPTY